MKKLNITKKQYDESKYFNNKYGALKFVSESGKLFKTDKGVVLALEGTDTVEPTDESLADIGAAIKKTGGEVVDKVKHGYKKAKQAVGDWIHGIYRKGDSVTIQGKAGSLEGKVVSAEPDEVVIKPNEPEREIVKEDEEDEAEVTVKKDELADALQGVIDTVKDIAADNDVELPEEKDDDEDEGKDDDDAKRDGEYEIDEGDEGCPECECGGLAKESIRRRRARMVRESLRRRARARKVLESIRRRRALKRMMESRRARARRARVAR